MSEEQANELAARIKAEFPHVFTYALPSIDDRNAPRHFFVAVKRAPMGDDHEHEWQEALTALRVLSN